MLFLIIRNRSNYSREKGGREKHHAISLYNREFSKKEKYVELYIYVVFIYRSDLFSYRHPGLGYLASPPHPYSSVHEMS